jgi:hypothetical protein
VRSDWRDESLVAADPFVLISDISMFLAWNDVL